MVAGVPILNSHQPGGSAPDAGLLPQLLFRVGPDSLVLIAPAPGEVPKISVLPDQQHLAVQKQGAPGGDLGGLIAPLTREQSGELFQRQVGVLCQNFR